MFEVSFILHDASRATGVPVSTLRYFIKKGELPVCKLGRTRVIRPSSLDAFLATYEVRVLNFEGGEAVTSALPERYGSCTS
jgi:excisionase family DNA binding protein